jgi:hypothetical protein
VKTKLNTFVCVAIALGEFITPVAYAQDSLPSWNDTAPKKAIIAFVEKVTNQGSSDLVLSIAAFANSDGDQQMFECTIAGSGARFALLVHHYDAEREFAYGRKIAHRHARQAVGGSECQRVDRFSMKDDCKTVLARSSRPEFTQNHQQTAKTSL